LLWVVVASVLLPESTVPSSAELQPAISAVATSTDSPAIERDVVVETMRMHSPSMFGFVSQHLNWWKP